MTKLYVFSLQIITVCSERPLTYHSPTMAHLRSDEGKASDLHPWKSQISPLLPLRVRGGADFSG